MAHIYYVEQCTSRCISHKPHTGNCGTAPNMPMVIGFVVDYSAKTTTEDVRGNTKGLPYHLTQQQSKARQLKHTKHPELPNRGSQRQREASLRYGGRSNRDIYMAAR